MLYTCLVCGYPELDRDPNDSHDFCPSCGIQYGYDDLYLDISYEDYRAKWIKNGMQWQSRGVLQPPNWNPRQQLLNIGVRV